MNGNRAIQFSPPSDLKARLTRYRRNDELAEAFAEHCNDGGQDFLQYLRPWHMVDALESINDAANGAYPPEVALVRIREALGELIAIAVVSHREALEWDDVGAGSPRPY